MTIILSTSPVFGLPGDLPARLADKCWQVIRATKDDQDELIPQADFLVAGQPKITADLLARAPRLQGILKHGVGLDTIDLPACTARRLPVTTTPGANANAVAELALAQIFILSRHLIQGHTTVTNGHWTRTIGTEVAGTNLGIVGFGAIGQTLAAKARALGMQVLAHSRHPDHAAAKALGVQIVPLPELLSRSDHISLHVFGGPASTNLIGPTELTQMKPTATLLNLSRGDVVDLDALAHALTTNRLAAAALDTFPIEPPDTTHPIFRAPNVIFSPHSGGDTQQALIRMGHMILDDIDTILSGQVPARCINLERPQ